MRRASIVVASLVVGLAFVVAPGTAAGSGRLAGTFTIHFPKGHPASNAPCPPDEFCGVGTLQGFGKATITIVDENFEEIPDSDCLAVNWIVAIEPVGDGDVLVLDENGTVCPPGGSGDSNAGPSSYGHPSIWSFTYTVNGAESQGVFAGASGSGTARFESAGAVGVWTLRGTLSLA